MMLAIVLAAPHRHQRFAGHGRAPRNHRGQHADASPRVTRAAHALRDDAVTILRLTSPEARRSCSLATTQRRFAAKAVEPRAPLWTLIAGAQLVDIGWGGARDRQGSNAGRVDPAHSPAVALVLEHMPWTHSLPAAVAWSVGAAMHPRATAAALSPWRAAVAIAAQWCSRTGCSTCWSTGPTWNSTPSGTKARLRASWEHGRAGAGGGDRGCIASTGGHVLGGPARARSDRPPGPPPPSSALLVTVQIIAMLMPAGGRRHASAELLDAMRAGGLSSCWQGVAVFLDGRKPTQAAPV
jgi:hypothetical protein